MDALPPPPEDEGPPPSGEPYHGAAGRAPLRPGRRRAGGWYVADAGMNAILHVSKRGRHLHGRRAAAAADQGDRRRRPPRSACPACTVGSTYAFEPVPTDVEVAGSGKLIVSTAAGRARGREPGCPRCGLRGQDRPGRRTTHGTARTHDDAARRRLPGRHQRGGRWPRRDLRGRAVRRQGLGAQARRRVHGRQAAEPRPAWSTGTARSTCRTTCSRRSRGRRTGRSRRSGSATGTTTDPAQVGASAGRSAPRACPHGRLSACC